MPKAEKGSIKDLANKMKSKGLQKLRWYCQMCQKQCRDENGFKCHTTSESHQRQLLLFAENPFKYLDEFSKQFSDDFVELLRRRFGTKRVYANQVYQEYIADKNHLHMNATKWLSLTEFIQWLGKEGKCSVDETEKGWYITWIDRDPETIARQQAGMKKKKMDKDDQERMLEFIEKQVERGKTIQDEVQYSEIQRKSEDEKIVAKFDIKPVSKVFPMVQPSSSSLLSNVSSVFKDSASKRSRDSDTMSMKSSKSSKSSTDKRKLSALEEIRLEEERRKEWKKKKEDEALSKNIWIMEGIVVKIISKTLGDKYYKEKGVVLQMLNRDMGLVKLLESGHKLKLEQEHLETVIPSKGRRVKILKGKYRGTTAILKSLDVDNYCVDVEVIEGPNEGKILRGLPYEEISKLYVD